MGLVAALATQAVNILKPSRKLNQTSTMLQSNNQSRMLQSNNELTCNRQKTATTMLQNFTKKEKEQYFVNRKSSTTNPKSMNRLAKQKNCNKADHLREYKTRQCPNDSTLQQKYISTSIQLSGEKDCYNFPNKTQKNQSVEYQIVLDNMFMVKQHNCHN